MYIGVDVCDVVFVDFVGLLVDVWVCCGMGDDMLFCVVSNF